MAPQKRRGSALLDHAGFNVSVVHDLFNASLSLVVMSWGKPAGAKSRKTDPFKALDARSNDGGDVRQGRMTLTADYGQSPHFALLVVNGDGLAQNGLHFICQQARMLVKRAACGETDDHTHRPDGKCSHDAASKQQGGDTKVVKKIYIKVLHRALRTMRGTW